MDRPPELDGAAQVPRGHLRYGPVIAERRYRPAWFTTVLGRRTSTSHSTRQRPPRPAPTGELLRAVFDRAVADGRGADDWAVIAEQQPRATAGDW